MFLVVFGYLYRKVIKRKVIFKLNMVKIYCYEKCGTCKKAKTFLEENNIKFQEIPIREQTPTKSEMKKMLNKYGVKRLFNTSGKDYRELGIKSQLVHLTEGEIVDLLRSNGNLIKRPFLVSGDKYFVGFKENEWENIF